MSLFARERLCAGIATALVVVGAGTACGDGDLTSAEVPAQAQQALLSSPQGSSCHAVRGLIEADVSGANPIGTISGDLEGSIETVLEPDWLGATDKFSGGRSIHLSGTQTVQIDGGTIPALVGTTIVWETRTKVVHLPPIRRVTNVITVLDGASGKLVSHGILDLVELTTAFEYEGVICS